MPSAVPPSRSGGKHKTADQAGDPRKLADAVVMLAAMDPPPDRFFAGRDVFDIAERKIAELQAAIDALPELSTSLTVDEP